VLEIFLDFLLGRENMNLRFGQYKYRVRELIYFLFVCMIWVDREKEIGVRKRNINDDDVPRLRIDS